MYDLNFNECNKLGICEGLEDFSLIHSVNRM
jgi:hypothetical protein